MKYLGIALVLLFLISCKHDTQKSQEIIEQPSENLNKDIPALEKVMPFDTLYKANDAELDKTKSIVIKRQSLIDKKDDKYKLEKLVTYKTFKRDKEMYLIDFKYPYLSENIKASYSNFNEYLEKTYMDIAGIEANILKEKEMFCDISWVNRFKEQRFIDYKLYALNDRLISIVLYKENYYAGAMHPSYSFDCVNFDLQHSVFMNYENFFNTGSEEEMTQILNSVLRVKIDSVDIYFDCWEISFNDFFNSKNNFVIDDLKVEYYFDDCVICPSYTGAFSVEIPLKLLMPVLRKYKSNPLVM